MAARKPPRLPQATCRPEQAGTPQLWAAPAPWGLRLQGSGQPVSGKLATPGRGEKDLGGQSWGPVLHPGFPCRGPSRLRAEP